jgi:hypothetical protein
MKAFKAVKAVIAAIAVVGVLGVPSLVCAQTPAPITSYELQIYLAGVDPQLGGAPIQVNAVPLTAFVCNLAPSPALPPTLVNPRGIEIDDPALAGRKCLADRSAFLLALPIGTGYRATITALSAAGPSARSNTSNPFDVALGRPVAPKGLEVRP